MDGAPSDSSPAPGPALAAASSSQGTRLRAALWALAALPCLLAVIAHARPVSPAPIAAAAERPPLAFDQYTVNLHEVALQPVISAFFQFTNRGDKPIQITKVDPSCGCITPRLYEGKKDYAPGERGRFTVGVKTEREQAGPKEYLTKVEYVADGQTYEETLALRVTLPKQKVTIDPPEVYFYQLTGQPDSRTIYVVDTRGGQLEVESAEINSPHAQVTVGRLEVDDEGRRRYPIRIDVAGEVPTGKHPCRVIIKTNDEDFDTIQASVMIFGPTSGNIIPASGLRPSAGPSPTTQRPIPRE